MGYFNPWRNAPDQDCRTCLFSIGMRDGAHLCCQRQPLVVVFPCGGAGDDGGKTVGVLRDGAIAVVGVLEVVTEAIGREADRPTQ